MCIGVAAKRGQTQDAARHFFWGHIWCWQSDRAGRGSAPHAWHSRPSRSDPIEVSPSRQASTHAPLRRNLLLVPKWGKGGDRAISVRRSRPVLARKGRHGRIVTAASTRSLFFSPRSLFWLRRRSNGAQSRIMRTRTKNQKQTRMEKAMLTPRAGDRGSVITSCTVVFADFTGALAGGTVRIDAVGAGERRSALPAVCARVASRERDDREE